MTVDRRTTAEPDDVRTVTRPGRVRGGLVGALVRGVVAGVVAGLVLTTVQALARLVLGVAPPAELVGDRIAPLLTIDQFFGLFAVFGGYNELKQAGVLGGTAGQLAVGVVIATAASLVSRRSARRARRVLVVLTGLLLVTALAVLWPILGTSYVGWPPSTGRVVTVTVMVVSFGVLGTSIGVVLRLLAAPSDTPVDAPVDALVDDERRPGAPASLSRRALLAGGVGAVGIGLAAATVGTGAELTRRATFGYDGTRVFGPNVSPITPNDAFYTVTKNVVDPRVDAGRWGLTVAGAVGAATTWDLPALRARPQTTQETTLSCISNGVGDGLMSNAIWTGVPLADLIAAARPHDDAVEVLLTAVDGYTDTFSVDKALNPTTLLALQMNGSELPQRHGYPARLVVPGMYGEKNLKWITRIDLVTEETKGFYETQGWGPDFVIPTRSSFTSPTADGALVRRGQDVTLSGTAFGGDRGVSRVEVSTDGGSTWSDARITYPGTILSWALWSFSWRPGLAGPVTLAVRATDRTGMVQTATPRGIVPQGATGYHLRTVQVL